MRYSEDIGGVVPPKGLLSEKQEFYLHELIKDINPEEIDFGFYFQKLK